MDQLSFYNALIESAVSVCGQNDPIVFTKSGVSIKETRRTAFATSSSIVFSGGLHGRLTLSFSPALAEHLVRSWCGVREADKIQQLLPDTIGEIANLISAAAVARFDRDGRVIGVSPPAVVTGEHADTAFEGKSPLAVHLTSPHGDLEINVSIGGNS